MTKKTKTSLGACKLKEESVGVSTIYYIKCQIGHKNYETYRETRTCDSYTVENKGRINYLGGDTNVELKIGNNKTLIIMCLKN